MPQRCGARGPTRPLVRSLRPLRPLQTGLVGDQVHRSYVCHTLRRQARRDRDDALRDFQHRNRVDQPELGGGYTTPRSGDHKVCASQQFQRLSDRRAGAIQECGKALLCDGCPGRKLQRDDHPPQLQKHRVTRTFVLDNPPGIQPCFGYTPSKLSVRRPSFLARVRTYSRIRRTTSRGAPNSNGPCRPHSQVRTG